MQISLWFVSCLSLRVVYREYSLSQYDQTLTPENITYSTLKSIHQLTSCFSCSLPLLREGNIVHCILATSIEDRHFLSSRISTTSVNFAYFFSCIGYYIHSLGLYIVILLSFILDLTTTSTWNSRSALVSRSNKGWSKWPLSPMNPTYIMSLNLSNIA